MNRLPDRISKLAGRLDEMEIEAMLVTDEINVRYLSGFTGDSSYLWITKSDATILSDGRYKTQIAQECPSLETAIRYSSQLMNDLLREFVSGRNERAVGIEAEHFSLADYRAIAQACPDVRWSETSGVVLQQRMIKDESEIGITREAVRIAESAFQAMREELTPDWTERAVAFELEAKMRALGAEGVSFAPIVAAGPTGALPHYSPGDLAIADHPTLLIDWGACYDGYASDLTRTLHRDHASEKFRQAYQAVLEAQMTAIDAIRPGVASSEVDAAARNVLAREGLADAFVHGLGHGTGLEIHESPRMSAVSTETLASGMIITVEPGVYFEGDFGIRIEDDVLVTDDGHEVLSSLPKGLDDCRLIL